MNDASHRKQSAEIEWKYAIAASVAATAAAVGLMQLARSIYQIRTLPERVMEWILVFVPLDLFEQGLVAFGSAAKVLALGGAIVFMAAALLAVGAGAMRSGPIAVGAVTIGLWLFAMGVVMPVTGAGFFASSLLRDVMLTNLSYASVAFTYGTVLLLARLSLQNRARLALPADEQTVILAGANAYSAFLHSRTRRNGGELRTHHRVRQAGRRGPEFVAASGHKRPRTSYAGADSDSTFDIHG